MNLPFPCRLFALAFALAPAVMAAELQPPEPLGKPATKVYRQVLPGGRVIYSDKPVKGARLEETITVQPSAPSQAPPERATALSAGKSKTLDEAEADVIRAERLLEDARKRQEAGVEPLPGERTGTASGGSRLNESYRQRQQRLAEDVAIAENVLKKSIAERNAMQSSGR